MLEEYQIKIAMAKARTHKVITLVCNGDLGINAQEVFTRLIDLCYFSEEEAYLIMRESYAAYEEYSKRSVSYQNSHRKPKKIMNLKELIVDGECM